MPNITSQVRILPSQVQHELSERLQGGKSEKSTAAVHVELGNKMHAISVAETSQEAKSVGEGKKSFLTAVKDFFGSIKDAFIKFFNNVSTKSTNEATLAPVMAKQDKHVAAIDQNRAIIAIFHEQPDQLKTEGIMRLSAAKTELDMLSGGNKNLLDATAVELAALFKKNIREHLAPDDMRAIEQLFLTYQADQQLPALSQLPEMAKDAIVLAKDIAKFKDDNKMSASNLAIVIAPNMMSDNLLMTGKTMEFNTFIDKIIQQE
ncbi:RhoGAP domain-containing protein [Aeromonas veronii]|uniref:RhoGAP domain-containing protein n=1 Tax=Aeromonas veronii TaxID=654 RepID=UPI00366B1D24